MSLPFGYQDFAVRRLQTGDEIRLSRFYHSLSERSRSFFEPFKDTSVEAMREVIRRSLEGVDLHFVAEGPDDDFFAHFFFMDIARECPHLGIGIRDEYQELGLGSVFFAYLLSIGRHVLKKSEIGLTVVKNNVRALRLYRKMGFQTVRDCTFRSENDSYEMVKLLGP